jgi:thymidine kinase
MIELITGPMFSGKSTLLFQKMERYVYAGKTVVLVRPEKDTRDFFSHSPLDAALKNLVEKNKIDMITVRDFTGCRLTGEYDTVFIDEYFMIKDCWKLACCCGKDQDMYFAGLLATSECELFDETVRLLPYCDSIIKLNGVCTRCGSQYGNYSYYRKGDKTEAVVVGDNEYTCLCRDCYIKLQHEKKSQMELID